MDLSNIPSMVWMSLLSAQIVLPTSKFESLASLMNINKSFKNTIKRIEPNIHP